MDKIKENAMTDYLTMIEKSWTWERLTQEEIERFNDKLSGGLLCAIKGTYRNRWAVMQLAYSMFLAGCGYDSPNWREAKKTQI